MSKSLSLVIIALILMIPNIGLPYEPKQISTENTTETNQYTFAWSFTQDSNMKPRGGTTTGEKIVLDKSENLQWRAIREPKISKFEQDRRAILAMSGGYRTSFDFLETVGFTETHKPARPYQSWGTEFVYVVEDKGDFISLQHILVMYFEANNGDKPAPMVMKHWRQDWQYEPAAIVTFKGFDNWQKRTVTSKERSGNWSQSVYQVDDSPRYQAIGSWQHKGNYSSWRSGETWRPLPRREFSVRSDYQVLIGTNKHTITPTGWVQEEDNLKVKLDSIGKLTPGTPIVAKEIGLARYEKIIEHDWTPGNDYWEKTGPFWKSVRTTWSELLQNHQTLQLDSVKLKNSPMFMTLFGLADQFSGAKSGEEMHAKVKQAISSYLSLE